MKQLFPGKAVAAAMFAAFITSAGAAEVVKVVPEGGLAGDWMVRPGTEVGAPGYPQAFANRGEDVCVAMGYRVQADGTTSNYVLLRGWNSSRREIEPVADYWDTFGRASVGAIQKWRFDPKPGSQPGAQAPVDTVAVMTFHGDASNPTADLRSRCAVPDVVARMKYVRRAEDHVRFTKWNDRGRSRNQTMDSREASEAALAYAASRGSSSQP